MNDIFSGLAVVMGLAAGMGVAAKLLKQPPLIGYVMAGLVVGIAGVVDWPGMSSVMEVMGRLGVTLLLFLAGMEVSLEELKRMGKTSIVVALLEMTVVSGAGVVVARVLGFTLTEAVYIGLGLAFGSTILVVKLLSERGDLRSLPGKIAVGYLLVQDFVAIGLLVVLSGVGGAGWGFWQVAGLMIKGGAMVGLAILLAEKVMAKVADYFARSEELLFVTSIGWCLVIAAVVASKAVGFSVEIGGFLAGLTLARAAEQAQIIARVRPLRDFFLTWFFVAMGAGIKIGDIGSIWVPVMVFSAVVSILTPTVVYLFLGWLGYHKRPAFLASITVAQISEFSLILAAVGVRTGAVGDKVLTLMTGVAIVTMTSSSYLIGMGQDLYRLVKRYLISIGKSKPVTSVGEKLTNHVVMFGHNRTGSRIRPVVEKLGWKVVVVDFNPEVVEKLDQMGVRVMYGDASDYDLYSELGLKDCDMVISTVPDIQDNLHILQALHKTKMSSPVVVATAEDVHQATRLYSAGAEYVLVPNKVGGDFLADLIEHGGEGENRLAKITQHLKAQANKEGK